MKDESSQQNEERQSSCEPVCLHPSSFILHPFHCTSWWPRTTSSTRSSWSSCSGDAATVALPDSVPDDVNGRGVEKLWIAAVDTFAIGGHCQALLCMDFVLAADDAYLTLPARKEGIIPGFSNMRLPRFTGDRIARQAIFYERKLICDSPEGRLVCDEIAPPAEMDAALARVVVRFRWLVVALWIAVVVITSAAFPSLSSEINNDNSQFLPSSTPSSQAASLAAPILGSRNDNSTVTIVATSCGVVKRPVGMAAVI